MTLEPFLLVVLGLVVALIVLDRRVFALIDAQPDGDAKATVAGLGHTRWLLLPIGLALAAHQIAISMGHKRVGIQLAVAVLLLTTVVNAIVRIRCFSAAGFDRAARRDIIHMQLAATTASALAFLAVAAYLLRWV